MNATPNTSNAMDPLDPLTLRLRGSHLIEASAGTGKTFTIAMLYVRLVLGHGGEAMGHGRALTPPEILVVTFTEAATQELRDRIRARLAQAADYFRQLPRETTPPVGPDPLFELRQAYPQHEWAACARKLDVAAQWMDEAAVSTIHGWCNRMLHEHAFDSLSLFTQTLETDPSELRAEVVRDYWRQFYYPLSIEAATQVSLCWKHPSQLERAVRPLLEHAGQLPETPHPADLLERCNRDRRETLARLKAPWPRWLDELTQQLEEAREHKRFNGNQLRAAHYTAWLQSIREWATSEQESLQLTDAAWKRLTPTGIADAWREGTPLDHPGLHELPLLREALQQLPQAATGLLSHAARWIAAEFHATQRRRSQLGFDDLLRNLDTALHGDNGSRLAAVIRQQFPVALIDEFQDTDPIQYRIFNRIYELAQDRQDCALILIGDPKQAIYAFRGADIHTYLKARAAVGTRLHTLGTNYRSTQALVNATNHCFEHVEQDPATEGAFLFRHRGDNPVPFTRAAAQGLTSTFRVQGMTPPALRLNVLEHEGKLSKDSYIHQMADICATQLVEWLHQGQAGHTGFAEHGQPLTPIRPSDLAILVNNQHEADSIRRALVRRGVRSVYLSDKDTVYETPQATEVYRWLLACAEPDNDRLLGAALCTATLGLDLKSLDAFHSDEVVRESRLVQFKGYQDIWRKQGVLPMIRRLLFDFDCAARLLPLQADLLGQSGERILTDLLHLAELLQQASFTLEGEQALIRFLAEHIEQPQGGTDDKKLRLESDANLVQVVTIHKSKGLQYPVVMLPFICATRPIKPDATPIIWHDDTGELRVSLEADDTTRTLADRERLGEDVRKLYVALTRARHHTWLGLAYLETTPDSAVGHLMRLSSSQPASFLQAVGEFAQGHPDIQVVHTHAVHDNRYHDAAVSIARGPACRPRRPAREHWWISSYSNLPFGHQRVVPSHELDDTAHTENWLEGQQEQAPPDPMPSAAQGADTHPMHRFPKGAQPGTFLHDVMEWCANTGLPVVLQSPDALRDMISQRCSTHGWDTWIDPLLDWVRQLLTTPLPAGNTSMRLNEVTLARAEMEFWIEARHLDLKALDRAVLQHTLGGRPRPSLSIEALHGMLKGFMDLVFEHEGRYYVADYKSNWLGPDDTAYTAESMDEVIRANRYDLQYVLYLFALHRLLQSRLPDYDYDRHVGGVLYLFLRGIASPTAGVHFERPPKALMQQLDQLFSGHGEVVP